MGEAPCRADVAATGAPDNLDGEAQAAAGTAASEAEERLDAEAEAAEPAPAGPALPGTQGATPAMPAAHDATAPALVDPARSDLAEVQAVGPGNSQQTPEQGSALATSGTTPLVDVAPNVMSGTQAAIPASSQQTHGQGAASASAGPVTSALGGAALSGLGVSAADGAGVDAVGTAGGSRSGTDVPSHGPTAELAPGNAHASLAPASGPTLATPEGAAAALHREMGATDAVGTAVEAPAFGALLAEAGRSADSTGPPSAGQPAAFEPGRPDQALGVAKAGAPVPLAALPVEIGMRALDGVRQFEIRLAPEDLGRVDGTLRLGEEDSVEAHIKVERPETLLLLKRDARLLERAFEQAGLQAGSEGLRFSLRSDGQGGEPRRERDGSAPGHDQGRGPLAAPAAQIARPVRIVPARGLDISV